MLKLPCSKPTKDPNGRRVVNPQHVLLNFLACVADMSHMSLHLTTCHDQWEDARCQQVFPPVKLMLQLQHILNPNSVMWFPTDSRKALCHCSCPVQCCALLLTHCWVTVCNIVRRSRKVQHDLTVDVYKEYASMGLPVCWLVCCADWHVRSAECAEKRVLIGLVRYMDVALLQ